MCLQSTLGEDPGTGHFYLAKNRTFLLCVDTNLPCAPVRGSQRGIDTLMFNPATGISLPLTFSRWITGKPEVILKSRLTQRGQVDFGHHVTTCPKTASAPPCPKSLLKSHLGIEAMPFDSVLSEEAPASAQLAFAETGQWRTPIAIRASTEDMSLGARKQFGMGHRRDLQPLLYHS
jgi:hypothetical protein